MSGFATSIFQAVTGFFSFCCFFLFFFTTTTTTKKRKEIIRKTPFFCNNKMNLAETCNNATVGCEL